MFRAWTRNVSLVALVASLGLVGACASERDPIDRTQPNALDKSMFVGEWYYQQTVVEIPGTWSPTFVGETNFRGMERVRWEIQEDWLYARRSYERIKGAEGATLNDKTFEAKSGQPYVGAIIAAYPIQSHFDIRRAYNSTTGEEYNVLEENASDAPWFERKFMRVDWSKNYATNFDFALDDQPNYEGINKDPVAYYVQDPNDADYPVIDPGQFDKAGNMVRQPYLDVTNVMMLQPGLTYFKEYDVTYPTCWLFSRATADCTTEPVKIRSSFLRLDNKREYVPQPFKGEITDYFGLFANDLLTYDDKQEVTYKYKESYRNIHNLWKTWLDKNGNPLPGDQRGEVRPMIYYAHNWPLDLDSTLRNVEREWNTIFQRTVAAAQATKEDLESGKTVDKYTYDAPVFVVCHVPFDESRGDKKSLCVPSDFQDKPQDFKVRIGDVRYNFIAYLPNYYDGFALLGLGPSNTDPLTGENISAGAYLYVYNELVAQTTLEQIQLLAGVRSEDEYISGLDMKAWEDSVNAMAAEQKQRIVTDAQKTEMLMGQSMEWADKLSLGEPKRAGFRWESMQDLTRKVLPKLHDAGIFNGEKNIAAARLASLKGTPIETMLLNPEITLAAGIMPGSSLNSFNEEMLNQASVVRAGPIKFGQLLEKKKQYLAHHRGMDFMLGPDDGYEGLVTEFKEMAEKDPDALRTVLKDKIFHAVLAHELGHSFSLHHNMGATEDVVNYGDTYWQIRQEDNTVGPRWKDPITQNELDKNIYRHAYSSIMDYSRLTLDVGPGKYDAAAVLLGYADKVETFVDTGAYPRGSFIIANWAQYDGSVWYGTNDDLFQLHYTDWWKNMKEGVYQASNRKFADAKWMNQEDPNDPTGAGRWEKGLTEAGDSRVPYIFCSPYQTDIGNGCFTRDFGADEYERTQHHIQVANTWYVTRAFTRHKVGASPAEYVGRSYDRIYERLKGYNDSYALISGLLRASMPKAAVDKFLTDDQGWGGYTIAQHDMVNFLLNTIAMPTVDNFYLTTEAGGQRLYSNRVSGEVPDLNFSNELVNARYFQTSYDDGTDKDRCGMYFWECLHHYGFYLDKIMALQALTDPETYFVGRDTAEDIRQYKISFYDSYAKVLENFFGAMIAEDYDSFAPRFDKAKKKIVKHDYASGKIASDGIAIDPAAGFTVQLYAAILAGARWQGSFDKSFFKSMRTWLKGSKNEIETSLPTVEFTDLTTGYIYVAVDREGTVGKRVIDRVNKVFRRSSSCTSEPQCVSGLTEPERSAADLELPDYIEFLDVLVDMTHYFENGGTQYN